MRRRPRTASSDLDRIDPGPPETDETRLPPPERAGRRIQKRILMRSSWSRRSLTNSHILDANGRCHWPGRLMKSSLLPASLSWTLRWSRNVRLAPSNCPAPVYAVPFLTAGHEVDPS